MPNCRPTASQLNEDVLFFNDHLASKHWLGGLPRAGRGYKQAAEILAKEIVRLWRLAGEAIAAGFPEQLPDGSRRSGAYYPPLRRGPIIPSPSTSVKKAAA